MEDDIIVQETGVEGGEVASSNEGLDNPNTEVNAEGVEGSDVLGDENQDNTEVNTTGIDNSKAFADRLAKKTKAIEQQMQDKYAKYVSTIEKEAAKYGITAEEYLAEIDRQQQEEQAKRQAEADKVKYGDLSPEQIEKLKKADEIVANDATTQKYLSEAKALKEAFPNIKSSADIPDEVFIIKDTEGCSLLTAYKSYMYEQSKVNTDKFKIEAEQAAIKGLTANQNSPGSLSRQAPDNSPRSIKDIPDNEFEKMLEMVKMGKANQIKF